MKVGFTGHQFRPGIEWSWVRNEIRKTLNEFEPTAIGYSSLAIGSDQIFAEEMLARGDNFRAVIPYASYDSEFSGESPARYQALKAKSQVIELLLPCIGERAFYEAGRWIVDHSELMITVWDGEPSIGFGGTADIVAYAVSLRRPIVHIDTSRRKVSTKRGA